MEVRERKQLQGLGPGLRQLKRHYRPTNQAFEIGIFFSVSRIYILVTSQSCYIGLFNKLLRRKRK